MSSSRWKRFAFFDRKNLSIPTPVMEDMLPPSLFASLEPIGESKMSSNDASTAQSAKNDISATTIDSTIYPSKNHYVSFVVTNEACIPVANVVPKTNVGETVTGSTNETTQPPDPKILLSKDSGAIGGKLSAGFTEGLGLPGMLRSLAICQGANNINTDSFPRKIDETQQPLVIQLSESGEILLPSKDDEVYRTISSTKQINVAETVQTAPSFSSSSIPASSGYFDGSLVLAFASSYATPYAHCFDLSVRCTPIQRLSKWIERNDPDFDTTLEDLDGWRGFFYPFCYGFLDDVTTGTTSSNHPAPAVNSLPAALSTLPTTLNTASIVSTSTTSFPMAPPTSKLPSSLLRGKIIGMAICSSFFDVDGMTKGNRKNIYVASITDASNSVGVTVHKNPHLNLATSFPHGGVGFGITPRSDVIQPTVKFDYKNRGIPQCIDVCCYEDGIVTVGTDTGIVLVYTFNNSTSTKSATQKANKLSFIMEIPSPLVNSPSGSGGYIVTNVRLSNYFDEMSASNAPTTAVTPKKKSVAVPLSGGPSLMRRTRLYVTYLRKNAVLDNRNEQGQSATGGIHKSASFNSGVCCYDLGIICSSASSLPSAPSARFDLDSRYVSSSCVCDLISSKYTMNNRRSVRKEPFYFMVARTDGLSTYSSNEKTNVIPVDGDKVAFCAIPSSYLVRRKFSSDFPSIHPNKDVIKVESYSGVILSYVLVATTDTKSGRDAVNIYDLTNKLVVSHVLLSPGQRCLRVRAVGVSIMSLPNGSTRGGLSSTVILASNGSIITLTEKSTSEKVSLLVQKNLFPAAISVAFSDASYKSADVTALYRRYAEHLYRKSDFSAAMEQYIYTIGSLEPSHVIFRFLDAPKLPLLTMYLEELRSRGYSSSVQNELLRTCYLKLNDIEAAEKISVSLSSAMSSASSNLLISSLLSNPTEALAAICALEASKAAEAIHLYGATLCREHPRETAGIVLSLCDGTYSPGAFADFAIGIDRDREIPEKTTLKLSTKLCEQYSVNMFASAFLENSKLLRTILAYCNKNHFDMSPSLKCNLLELTLEEWQSARRTGEFEIETLRSVEAISILTDPFNTDMGDSEALVIVELAGFSEGQILLYERLYMTSSLIKTFAINGSEKDHRRMLGLCRSDPDLLATVLGHFVTTASVLLRNTDYDQSDELDVAYDNIRDALGLIRSQGMLPPARVIKVLAGEDSNEFSVEDSSRSVSTNDEAGVPLVIALDYIGNTLAESSQAVNDIKAEIGKYIQLCASIESELSATQHDKNGAFGDSYGHYDGNDFDVDEMYKTILQASQNGSADGGNAKLATEEFWKELDYSNDRFGTLARFMSRGVID